MWNIYGYLNYHLPGRPSAIANNSSIQHYLYRAQGTNRYRCAEKSVQIVAVCSKFMHSIFLIFPSDLFDRYTTCFSIENIRVLLIFKSCRTKSYVVHIWKFKIGMFANESLLMIMMEMMVWWWWWRCCWFVCQSWKVAERWFGKYLRSSRRNSKKKWVTQFGHIFR